MTRPEKRQDQGRSPVAWRPLALSFFLPFFMLLALPARAGLFDDDEARKRIEGLRNESDARVEKINRAQMDLSNQIEALQGQIAKLNGQLEVISHDLESTQKRQKDFYVDLDSRVRQLEPQADAGEAGGRGGNPATPTIDPAVETRDYEAALNLFKAGKLKDALAAFLAFGKTYPSSAFSPSALYWAGSAHYQLGEFKKASWVFNTVATTWPDDPKASDALLGLANSQRESGEAKAARKTLEQLVARYPTSAAAKAAKQRLGKK